MSSANETNCFDGRVFLPLQHVIGTNTPMDESERATNRQHRQVRGSMSSRSSMVTSPSNGHGLNRIVG